MSRARLVKSDDAVGGGYPALGRRGKFPLWGTTFSGAFSKGHSDPGTTKKPLPGLVRALFSLAFCLVGEFAVVDQPKAAIPTSIAEAPTPFMFAAKGVIELDVSVEPKRCFSISKIDSISYIERCIQQAAKGCAGCARRND